MPRYNGNLSQQEQLLSRFVVNSPWRDDPDRRPIDHSAIVTCGICGRRFLDSGWLDQHLADGHPEDDNVPHLDLDAALSRAEGVPLSPFQIIARGVLDRINSGDLTPGSRVTLGELARYYGYTPHTANKAVRVLVTHGVIDQSGYGRYTTWTVADHEESQDEAE